LIAYDWPGNVRELENCVRFLLCTRAGGEVRACDLPLLPVQSEPSVQPRTETFKAAKHRVVTAFERAYVQESLLAHKGNIAAAAKASGKHRRAFFELMRRHGLTRPR
jgi:DNA-binding NtrC family response regulator